MGGNGRHMQNVKDFGDKVANITPDTDDTMISFVVSALFNSVPVPEVVDIVRIKLEQDDTLGQRTKSLSVADLLAFVLNTTYFLFGRTVYKQQSRAAMGSPIYPIVANLFYGKA